MQFGIKTGGKEFIFRSLSEEEASQIQDKKRLALFDKNHSMYDDGETELEATLVSPSKEELLQLLEESGNFLDQVWQKQLSFSGDQEVKEDPVTLEEKGKHLYPIVAVLWTNKEGSTERILFKKINRADTKLIKKEIADAGLLLNRMLRERAKLLCLEKEKAKSISEHQPFFFVNIGWFLWSKTFATLEDDVKK